MIKDIYQSLSDTLLVNLTVDGSLEVDKDVIQKSLPYIKTIQTV